jgi:hypothetical protein
VGKGAWMQLIRNDDYVIIKSNNQTKLKLPSLVFVVRALNKVIQKIEFLFQKCGYTFLQALLACLE